MILQIGTKRLDGSLTEILESHVIHDLSDLLRLECQNDRIRRQWNQVQYLTMCMLNLFALYKNTYIEALFAVNQGHPDEIGYFVSLQK